MKSPSNLGNLVRWLSPRALLTAAALLAWLLAAWLPREQHTPPRTLVLRDRSASAPPGLDERFRPAAEILDFAATPLVGGAPDSVPPSWAWKTDIERAVVAGLLALEPSGGRLWLVTDGRPTRGRLARAALLARRAGVPIDVTPLPPAVPFDARIERLQVPPLVPPGSAVPIRCLVSWEGELPGPLELILLEHRGGRWQEVDARSLDTDGGGAELLFTRRAPETGEIRLEVRIRSPQSPPPWTRNDVARASFRVDRRQRVLWLHSGRPDAAPAPASTDRFEVLPRRWPPSAGELAAADVAVLVDLTAADLEALGEPWDELVARRGGGLLALGSSRTLGPGGWAGEPIERWLPLRCTPPDEPGADLWILVDHSGSMAGDPLAQASRAVRSVLAGAGERDAVHLAGFAASLDPPLLLKPAGADLEPARVTVALAALSASGSTRLVEALESLAERLPASGERRQHVLVLSDGQASGADPEERLPAVGAVFAQKKAAISVHAAGSDPDRELLERLVSAGYGGRFYPAQEIDRLPELFLADVRKDWIRSGPLRVDAIRGASRLPDVERLVRTAEKEEAVMMAVSGEGEPVIARWQRGAGRVAVFTSGGQRGWAPAWRSADWDHLFDAVAPPARGAWSVRVEPDRKPGWLEVEVTSLRERPPDRLYLRVPGRSPLELERLGPEHWVGEVFAGSGEPLEAIELLGPDEELLVRQELASEPHRELAHWAPDREGLAELAEQTGGRVRSLDEPVPAPVESSLGGRGLSIALLAAGVILLLASRATRS